MARWFFDSNYTQRHLYHVKGVCFCGSIAPKMTVWVHRGPLHDPFRRFQFGTEPHVRIHACERQGDHCRRPRNTTRSPCPPGKPPVPPKSTHRCTFGYTALPGVPPGSRGAPYNWPHGAAARRSSGGGAVHLGLTEGLRTQGGRVREWDGCPRAWGTSGGARGRGARTYTAHGCRRISTKEG